MFAAFTGQVITMREVMYEGWPILLVTHDDGDSASDVNDPWIREEASELE